MLPFFATKFLIVAFLNLLFGGPAMAQPVVTRDPAPKTVDEFRDQVAKLKKLVYDPGALFRGTPLAENPRPILTSRGPSHWPRHPVKSGMSRICCSSAAS
jgi:hypothetical protein